MLLNGLECGSILTNGLGSILEAYRNWTNRKTISTKELKSPRVSINIDKMVKCHMSLNNKANIL